MFATATLPKFLLVGEIPGGVGAADAGELSSNGNRTAKMRAACLKMRRCKIRVLCGFIVFGT